MKTVFCNYSALTETPLYGSVEVQGEATLWLVEVPTAQARDMQKDGFTVGWVIGTTDSIESRLQDLTERVSALTATAGKG